MKKITRIGVGGPVGSGKTAIVEAITPRLLELGAVGPGEHRAQAAGGDRAVGLLGGEVGAFHRRAGQCGILTQAAPTPVRGR